MSWMQRLYRLVQPALFGLPAEAAHHLGLALLRVTPQRSWSPPPQLRREILGIDFASPIGLAAGFDKNACCLHGWRRLGFGFAEIGTVTPLPQPGNPKPRLVRLREERSLQNWMGFNGRGAAYVASRLAGRPHGFPLGVNIGKNAATPLERAVDDYSTCAAAVADVSDFLVINISSPNTPGLRTLQRVGDLTDLVQAAADAAPERPLLVKLSPDEELADLENLALGAVDCGASGVVVNNTSVDYAMARTAKVEHKGGISGHLISERSRRVVARIGAALAGRGVIVSVGGIDTVAEVYWRMRHGAALVELYTGLVYQGPDLPRRLATGLAERMDRDGVKSLTEIIGADL